MTANAQLEEEQGQREPATEASELEDLRKQLQAERSNRQAAEQRAEAAERVHQETAGRLTTEVDARFRAQSEQVDTALASLEQSGTAMEAQYAAALEAGDTKLAAKLNREIMANEVKASEARNAKNWIANQKEAAKRQAEAAAARPDPLAAFTPRTRAWMEEHPEYFSDQKFNKRAQAAHYAAVARDLVPDSDAYFDFVNRDLGLVKEPAGEEEAPPARERTASAASVAAPVSRSGATPISNGEQPRNGFRLTGAQKEAAEISFPDEFRKDPASAYRLYYDNMVALKAEGRLQ